ncbi:hypothetical protein QC823_14525 [Halomonas vilamensis]|uniref:Uncharacterized protein n=1 Tax=Vreelandella vilamensis TaxID=531309 RepID=A0ABU1H7J6_9GAMM|nr:hypothetical protein [Halomonas vilamensis]MDR5900189.1 hypothetical protein [Halomonas vilamensis]
MALLLTMLAWWQLPEVVAGMLFPLAWIVAAQLVFVGAFEAARLRRRAWLGQYLKKTSPWSRWLRGGVVMVVWHQLVSAILATVLLVSLRLAGLLDMALLVAGASLFWVCDRWARSRLARHVISDYLSAVTRRLLVAPASVLLVVGLIAVSLARPQPYLVGMELERAIQDHIVSNGQSLLSVFERGASALELASFWAVQNALDGLGVSGWAAVLGWAGVFALQSALALAFVRLLVGAAASHDALHRLGERADADEFRPDGKGEEKVK